MAVVSYWRKYVHEVLVNHLGGLSLPRKSVVRLTDCPDMTLDVYCGCKTTIMQTHSLRTLKIFVRDECVCWGGGWGLAGISDKFLYILNF